MQMRIIFLSGAKRRDPTLFFIYYLLSFIYKKDFTMVLAVDIGNSNICIGGLDGADHRTIAFTTRMVHPPPLHRGRVRRRDEISAAAPACGPHRL